MKTPLPTPWNFFNLRSSPFWQEALSPGDPAHPMSLFVGRTEESATLTNTIAGAGDSPTRQAVAGPPGVGKTTLVKRVQLWAHDHDYWAQDAVVHIMSEDTAERLFARVLAQVYSTIVAYRPHTADVPAMQSAQVLVHASRETVRGGGVSTPFGGVSVSQGVTMTTPREILIDGPRVLADLMALVRSSDARGVLVHLNNLENLTEAEAQNAGRILRDLRDPMLQHTGLHFLLVGTTEAVDAVLKAPQLRSVISVVPLGPLPLDDVFALLDARYRHLQVDPKRPLVAPVAPDTVEALYELFGGDARGVLAALEDGVSPNLGRSHGGASLDTRTVIQSATARYMAAFMSRGDDARYQQLEVWGRTQPDGELTQAELGTLWNLGQSAVSLALSALRAEGYVVLLARRPAGRGRPVTVYGLSGVARLLFAPPA
ncbi:MAG: AAA family ATPase [Gemmatimonadaceae bacterium]|nr:AAA family ATPase [Gemmatimonadaceae bacterium]